MLRWNRSMFRVGDMLVHCVKLYQIADISSLILLGGERPCKLGFTSSAQCQTVLSRVHCSTNQHVGCESRIKHECSRVNRQFATVSWQDW